MGPKVPPPIPPIIPPIAAGEPLGAGYTGTIGLGTSAQGRRLHGIIQDANGPLSMLGTLGGTDKWVSHRGGMTE